MNELLTIHQRWQASTPGEWITTAGSEGSLYENRIVCLQGEYTDADNAGLIQRLRRLQSAADGR